MEAAALVPASTFLCCHPKSKFPTSSIRLQICSPYPNLSLGKQLGCYVAEPGGVKVEVNERRKLFVLNLPWSLSVADIKALFGECGSVEDVEVIKSKEGKSRGFAFVTMSSGPQALAAIHKFHSQELLGRIIRVDFAKRFKKPPGVPPPTPPRGETRHKLYVSNLAWKVRSTQLRDFFSANYNPVSARVVFSNASGRAAGYGFVSFDTKEEAEAALSALDGKELMGRPIRLKFSERNADGSENKEETPTQESLEGQ